MTYPQAIVVSAALLAGAILTTARVESQPSPQHEGVGATYDANRKVAVGWSMDSKSGKMRACVLNPTGSAGWDVKCFSE
jgi:hypothetical protein